MDLFMTYDLSAFNLNCLRQISRVLNGVVNTYII